MKIFFNEKYAHHDPKGEIHHGEIVSPFENPSRIHNILAALKENGISDFNTPDDFGLDPILDIHPDHYVSFLQNIWNEWQAAGHEHDIVPYIWPVPGLKRMNHPELIAKIGTYAFSSDSAIMKGTWEAAYNGAQCALSAVNAVHNGERSAFVLSRPPGHHAHASAYGGYCYLNNGAIAAQFARNKGYKKVCVLDVDYHHGNGTQDIFFDRGDVLTISLHGHPSSNFPYYLGFEDETGEGDGEGSNLNFALPDGTTFDQWQDAFAKAHDKIKNSDIDFLVVPLGVDTFEGDPISKFKLSTDDFTKIGALIEKIGLPTVFLMEGGYDVGPIGQNVFNVLNGFTSQMD